MSGISSDRITGTAALYARISLDRQDGEGVARQLDDCHALADERGWSTTREYVDNDVSAYRARRRPAFEELLADIEAGQISALVAWHPDRLYRKLADLERLIDAIKAAGVEVVTVRAGDLDLGSASGRMVAGILGSVARGESERMGERVARAKLDRAMQGRPAGGGVRPFGFESDRVTVHPVEAAALAGAAKRITTGVSSYNAEARAMNDAGLTTTAGKQWTVVTLRRALTAPRVTGLRSYKGRVVGEAVWPAIIDRDTWERLCSDAWSRRKGGRPATAGYLLRGLVTCHRCGRPLYGSQVHGGHAYRCVPTQTTTGRGCGGTSITGRPLDTLVLATVQGWLTGADARQVGAHLAGGRTTRTATTARSTIDDVETRMVTLAERWAAGLLETIEYHAARQVLAARRTEAEDTLRGEPSTARPLGGVTVGELEAGWAEMTQAEHRAAIDALAVTPIIVGPGRDADQVIPLADRVAISPAWG